jgi:hypothetical protein
VKFYPIETQNFSPDILTMLDRDGFSCSDIIKIDSNNSPKENRYANLGKKEIPNNIIIKVDSQGFDYDATFIKYVEDKIKKHYSIPIFELDKYNGFMLFYNPTKVQDNQTVYVDFALRSIKPDVRYHYLNTKLDNDNLTLNEIEELKILYKERAIKQSETLMAELNKTCLQMTDLVKGYPLQLNRMPRLLEYFNEEEVIVSGKHTIWWDLERFLHIYLGHVDGVKIGDKNKDNFVFQYEFREVSRIIQIILSNIHKEIIEWFDSNPNKDFKRQGKWAVNYDGNFYRIHIRPDGRLMAVHPYRDYNETLRDND